MVGQRSGGGAFGSARPGLGSPFFPVSFRPAHLAGTPIDPSVVASLIQAGQAVATSAIESAGSAAERRREAAAARRAAAQTAPAAYPSPAADIPWGPIALGGGALLALVLLLSGRRSAPAPQYVLANPRRSRRGRKVRRGRL